MAGDGIAKPTGTFGGGRYTLSFCVNFSRGMGVSEMLTSETQYLHVSKGSPALWNDMKGHFKCNLASSIEQLTQYRRIEIGGFLGVTHNF